MFKLRSRFFLAKRILIPSYMSGVRPHAIKVARLKSPSREITARRWLVKGSQIGSIARSSSRKVIAGFPCKSIIQQHNNDFLEGAAKETKVLNLL